MKKILLVVFLLGSFIPVIGQVFYESYNYRNNEFIIYPFEMGGDTKVKYFTNNAPYFYRNWQTDKWVDVICAGAFSETWSSDSKPVGFTINNGHPVNYAIDSKMDALVLVQSTHVEVLDLDQLENGIQINEDILKLNPRNSALHRKIIIDAAEKSKFSVFQTQLLYSRQRISNFGNIYYGKKAERRFLAVCTKATDYYNIIVDVPTSMYLNLAAKQAKEVLEYAQYTVEYIINLDTGGKNIFYRRSSSKGLTKLYNEGIEKSTNLIIFYRK